MKFQIIKDLDSSRTSLYYYLWEVGIKGEKIYCIYCDKDYDNVVNSMQERIEKYLLVKNFKPTIVKEIEL